MKTRSAISLPKGVRDILPEEAEKITRLESSILSVFNSCGFQRVITPLLEYTDVLSLGMGQESGTGIVKFVEPLSGRVMAIRPDVTPQIARLVATRMRDYELPLKLCYNANVLRSEEKTDTGLREVLQIGAEHISLSASPEADASMVVMAIEALKQAGIEDFKIDIGHVGFVKEALARLNVGAKEKEKIKNAIAKKDNTGLAALLNSVGKKIDEGNKKLLLSLTSFYGEEEVLEKAAGFFSGPGAIPTGGEPLEYVSSVLDAVFAKGYKDYITIDLGEVRGFDYYTGIIFEGFATGVGKAILGGGRYDTLIERYGFKASSTGFAFNMDNLILAAR